MTGGAHAQAATWFSDQIVATGRLPLFCFFAGMVVGFLFIRMSVRLIRAEVRWWPGNVAAGGVHVHHMVFGVVIMVFAGVAGLVIPDDLLGWRAAVAALFGIGTALVLDEFALILRLRDVYWSEQGRVSVDALFAVTAVTGMLLVGMHPFLVEDAEVVINDQQVPRVLALLPLVALLATAAVTVLKGKVWTGLAGMFIPVLLVVGAARLARPHSPWARWRYTDHRRGGRKLARARRREDRLRAPVTRAKNKLEDLVAGRPDH